MPMKKMKEKMEQKMAGRKKGPGGAKPPKGDFQHQGPGTGKAAPANLTVQRPKAKKA
jgi:hypothetical protein